MNQNLQFHVFTSNTKTTSGNKMPLNTILGKIKNGDSSTPLIEAVRAVDKSGVLYEAIISARESIIWNTTYGFDKRNNRKVLGGILHMSKENMSPDLLQATKLILTQLDYVLAAWVSIDGNGIECLVRCDEINLKNLQEFWHEINNCIGIDFACKGVGERTAISYDPDIYIRLSANNFPSKNPLALKAEKIKKVQHALLIKEYDRIAPEDYDLSPTRFRYQTEFHDYVFGNEEYKFFPKGIPFYKINTYYRVYDDMRMPTMYAQAAILMCLNPKFDKRTFIERLQEINIFQCSPRLGRSDIEFVVHQQFERLRNGTLVIEPRIRKIVYKTGGNMTLLDIRQLNGSLGGQSKIMETEKLIKASFTLLMDKGKEIILKDLIAVAPRSKRTVITYWNKTFKYSAAAYNRMLKNGWNRHSQRNVDLLIS